MDPEMMSQLMDKLGSGGLNGAGMDMEGMMAGLNGGGQSAGGPSETVGSKVRARMAEEGEKEADGYKWEFQTQDDEPQVQVRFALDPPATKKDVQVRFTPSALSVRLSFDGVQKTLVDGKLAGLVHAEECTWCAARLPPRRRQAARRTLARTPPPHTLPDGRAAWPPAMPAGSTFTEATSHVRGRSAPAMAPPTEPEATRDRTDEPHCLARHARERALAPPRQAAATTAGVWWIGALSCK